MTTHMLEASQNLKIPWSVVPSVVIAMMHHFPAP
jgi:hypothetical protein